MWVFLLQNHHGRCGSALGLRPGDFHLQETKRSKGKFGYFITSHIIYIVLYVPSINFTSPELKAQVRLSNRPSSIVSCALLITLGTNFDQTWFKVFFCEGIQMKGPTFFHGGMIAKYQKYIDKIFTIFLSRITASTSTKCGRKYPGVKGILYIQIKVCHFF